METAQERRTGPTAQFLKRVFLLLANRLPANTLLLRDLSEAHPLVVSLTDVFLPFWREQRQRPFQRCMELLLIDVILQRLQRVDGVRYKVEQGPTFLLCCRRVKRERITQRVPLAAAQACSLSESVLQRVAVEGLRSTLSLL